MTVWGVNYLESFGKKGSDEEKPRKSCEYNVEPEGVKEKRW